MPNKEEEFLIRGASCYPDRSCLVDELKNGKTVIETREIAAETINFKNPDEVIVEDEGSFRVLYGGDGGKCASITSYGNKTFSCYSLPKSKHFKQIRAIKELVKKLPDYDLL